MYIFKEVDLTQFESLCDKLREKGIEFEAVSRLGGKSLAIPSYAEYSMEHDGNRTVSVICFDGSYGSDDGLLEIYAAGLNEGVEGYLTAEQAFEYIEDTLNGISRGSCG